MTNTKKAETSKKSSLILQFETDSKSLVTVFLMATHDGPGLRNALRTLRKHGMPYRVLAFGDAWKGWRERMRQYQEAAATCQTQYCVMMDAYDALSIRPVQGLVEAFLSYNKNILIGMESSCGGNCKPIDSWWNKKAKSLKSKTDNWYVNGGLLMGTREAIADMYQWCLNDSSLVDDQVALGHYCLAFPDSWFPDVFERVFTNKPYGKLLTLNQQTQNGSYFAHFPGAKDFLHTKNQYMKTAKSLLKSKAKEICGGQASILMLWVALAVALLAFSLVVVFASAGLMNHDIRVALRF
jgi:hypothetical protein